MKAKEYFEKYRSNSPFNEKSAEDLVLDLSMDMKKLLEDRHVKTDSGVVAVLKEVNGKYNAINRLFEKEVGVSPLRKDGFLMLYIDLIPEFKKHFPNLASETPPIMKGVEYKPTEA